MTTLGSTTTSEVSSTTSDAPDTTTSSEATSSTVNGGGLAETPEEAVLTLFQAMEDKDFEAFFGLMDPAAVEEVLGGLPLEQFKEYMGEEMWPWESMEFSGIKLEAEETGDDSATVTVVEGIATLTDFDGVTSATV